MIFVKFGFYRSIKRNTSLACGAVGDVDLIEVSRKIEHATAPILRPSKLIAVGQPQPALLRLAHVLDEKVFIN